MPVLVKVAGVEYAPPTISSRHGGRRYTPYVFTEQGALMAATALNTPLAVGVSDYVVRALWMLLTNPLTSLLFIAQTATIMA